MGVAHSMERVMGGASVSEEVPDEPSVASRSAREVISAVCGEFEEFGEGIVSEDPLSWPGYEKQLERAGEKSGEGESVVVGEGGIGGTPAVVIAFDFGFLGGSIGEATGRRIVAAFERAVEKRIAVVSFVATGGARMQEGMRSLVQMRNVAEAVGRARSAGVPHISVLRHPTTGGVWASLASTAEYIIGIKSASVSFAGTRVRGGEDDGNDADAFSASGKFRDGFIDDEVGPEELPEKLSKILALLSPEGADGAEKAGAANVAKKARGGKREASDDGDAAKAGAAGDAEKAREGKLGSSKTGSADGEAAKVGSPKTGSANTGTADGEASKTGSANTEAVDGEVAHTGERDVGEGDRGEPPISPPPVPFALGGMRSPRKAWAAVMRARRPHKPGASVYLDRYFDDGRVDISGDRVGGVDEGMVCGFGRKDGRTIAYAAQSGTANTAAGFRTAKRLVETAGRLGIPVLTLIDTPGASNDAKDEREGIGTAIAELFVAVAESEVPMTSLVVGEGGSGGALALAAAGNMWITPDAYFAVIAPEGAAAIIEKDPSKAEEISERMMLRPRDLVSLGVVRGIANTRSHPARVLKMPYNAIRRWVTNRSGNAGEKGDTGKECA